MRTILARVAPLAFAATIASGALIPVGTVDQSGTGFGTVDTILTIQDNGTEVGCVGRSTTVAGDITGAEGCALIGLTGGDERLTGSGNKTATLLIDPTTLDLNALRMSSTWWKARAMTDPSR